MPDGRSIERIQICGEGHVFRLEVRKSFEIGSSGQTTEISRGDVIEKVDLSFLVEFDRGVVVFDDQSEEFPDVAVLAIIFGIGDETVSLIEVMIGELIRTERDHSARGRPALAVFFYEILPEREGDPESRYKNPVPIRMRQFHLKRMIVDRLDADL